MMQKKYNGYTLMELIISISIITIMVAVTVGVYSFGRKYETLRSETNKVAATLRNTRNRAVNGVTFLVPDSVCATGSCCTLGQCGDMGTYSLPPVPCSADADCPSSQTCDLLACSVSSDCTGLGICSNALSPRGGYGLYMNSDYNGVSTYTIFADIKSATEVSALAGYYYEGLDESVEGLTLPSGFEFVLTETNADRVEFRFNGTALEIREKRGSLWEAPLDLSSYTTYTFDIQHEDGCAATRNQKGQIEIDTRTFRIVERIVDC